MLFRLNYAIPTKLIKILKFNKFLVLRRAVFCKKIITEVRSLALSLFFFSSKVVYLIMESNLNKEMKYKNRKGKKEE
jgi:hypothetical protein